MIDVRQAIKPRRTSFKRTDRILKPADFKRVFRKNVVSSDRYFKVLGRHNEGHGSRLGMAVSRQVDKRAVGRNRLKRVIRESFRHSPVRPEKQQVVAPGSEKAMVSMGCMDLVVLPRRESASVCNRQLFLSLDKHWLRIREKMERKNTVFKQESAQTGYFRSKPDAGII
jgi:ribonuclease P protein component